MNKHFIYHIFGKKIGVTTDVIRRMKQQSVKEGEYRVIEEYTNAKTASVREQELQVQYGYRVDKIPYYKTLRNQKKATTPEVMIKRTANFDYKARTANFDYKAKAEKCKKPIIQFDLQGNFIKQWDSVTKVGIKLNITPTNIVNCLKGRQKTGGGYIWKYAN